MRHVILAIAFGSLLSVAPISANTEPATATAAPEADPDQKIKCRKIEVTGSMVKKGKVCKTIAQWRATSLASTDGGNAALPPQATTRYITRASSMKSRGSAAAGVAASATSASGTTWRRRAGIQPG